MTESPRKEQVDYKPLKIPKNGKQILDRVQVLDKIRDKKKKSEGIFDHQSTNGMSDNSSYRPDHSMASFSTSKSPYPENRKKKLDKPVPESWIGTHHAKTSHLLIPHEADGDDPMDDIILGSLKPW